jgi:diamine N-acetyltransferase
MSNPIGLILLNKYQMEYIRKATPADAERIRFIAEQCWWLTSGDVEAQKKTNLMVYDLYSHRKLTNEINKNLSTFLLVIDGESAVAFTSYTLKKKDVITCELHALYCLPETQGKRFDELLVKEVLKNTIAEGGNSIFVLLTNYLGGVGLFERLGFKPNKITSQNTLMPDVLIMSKNLGTSK